MLPFTALSQLIAYLLEINPLRVSLNIYRITF